MSPKNFVEFFFSRCEKLVLSQQFLTFLFYVFSGELQSKSAVCMMFISSFILRPKILPAEESGNLFHLDSGNLKKKISKGWWEQDNDNGN